MKKIKDFWNDTRGDSIVVEATILFPIIIMIFAGLVLLSVYLPVRASLQHATQRAAIALATERSDTWLFYDEYNSSYYFAGSINYLDNVYVALFRSILPGRGNNEARAEQIVHHIDENSPGFNPGTLIVEYEFVNLIVYREVSVTATRVMPVPVDLSFVGFPNTISITATSTAVVQDGSGFVRNMDLAVDVAYFITDSNPISKLFSNVTDIASRIGGWLFSW